MNMTRRGFLWGLVKASAAVAVVANVVKKAPVAVVKPVPVVDPTIEWNRHMMKLAEQFDPFIQSNLNGKWKWVHIQDVKCGNRIGNFQGTFEIFPKPESFDHMGGCAFLTRESGRG